MSCDPSPWLSLVIANLAQDLAVAVRDLSPMSENVCTCEKCFRYKVKHPVTGFTVQGRIVGKKEFLEHRRLEAIKRRRLDDATDSDDGCTTSASSHLDLTSNNSNTLDTSEQSEKPRNSQIPTEGLKDRAAGEC